MTLAPMRSRTNRLKPKMSPQASARLKSSFSLRTILRAVARKLTPFSSAPWKTWSCYAAIMNGNPGVHVKMTSDISVGEWEPFYPSSGYITEAFSGVFDGCGHSITNLSVNRTTTNVGFFGGINGATIKNLHVSGTVSSTKAYVGGIVGKVQQGSLTGCSFSGSVSTGAKGSTAYARRSGWLRWQQCLADRLVLELLQHRFRVRRRCGRHRRVREVHHYRELYNTGSVTGTSRAGGICGQLQNNGSVERCYSTGTISGSDTASDIVDFLYGSSTIKTCGYVHAHIRRGHGTVDEESCVQSDDPRLPS